MNINKYTEKAREAVASAIELARQANNPQVEPEHLAVALVEQADGIVPELLRKMNVDPAAIARAARELTKKLTQAYGDSEPGMSPRFTASRHRMVSSASVCALPNWLIGSLLWIGYVGSVWAQYQSPETVHDSNFLPGSPYLLFFAVNYFVVRCWWRIDPTGIVACEHGLIVGALQFCRWDQIIRYTWSGK